MAEFVVLLVIGVPYGLLLAHERRAARVLDRAARRRKGRKQ